MDDELNRETAQTAHQWHQVAFNLDYAVGPP